MNLLLVYFITFAESIGTGILQRGIYFYTQERLGFGQLTNLLLALAYGVVYIGGALSSHAAAKRLGERRMVQLTVALLLALHVAVTLAPTSGVLCSAFVLSAFLRGIKWPVFESFVSAGRTPREILKAVGTYNVVWASSMPIAIGIAGPLISSPWPTAMFALPAAINVLSLVLLRFLPADATHIDMTHPERPTTAELRRTGDLLVSARWSLLAGYALLFLLAPLMPEIFRRLRVEVEQATPANALFDVVRVASFIVVGRTGRTWQGRSTPLAAAAVLLPVGFLMVLLGPSLASVLAGEVVFGAATGFAYTASLYYALVVKNASVDAGGAHEGLIGLGFALGPLAGIIGSLLSGHTVPVLGNLDQLEGVLVAVLPIIGACIIGGLRSLNGGRGVVAVAK